MAARWRLLAAIGVLGLLVGFFPVSSAQAATSCAQGQFLAEYFDNRRSVGTLGLSRCEAAINHDWKLGSPGGTLGTDRFYTRWTGTIDLAAGEYTFTARADDGVRVSLDGVRIIDGWRNQSATTYTAKRTVSAGSHRLFMEYYEHTGYAVAQLGWAAASTRTTPTTGGLLATDSNALQRRVGNELKGFTDWLARNGVRGYIGEAGWPADSGWNTLAERWYQDAARADLWVTAWATGEWWPADHALSIYTSGGQGFLAAARGQAPVVERQSSQRRGINVNGGEFGQPWATAPTASFSNANPGTYDRDWHYDAAQSFDYLASRGISTVRLAFRWERIQPQLGGPLDSVELARLRAAVARARNAGLGVILNVHNYGGYYLSDGSQGIRRAIGTPELPKERFADLWRRLSVEFRNDAGVIGYGLMNEPQNLPSVNGLTPAQVWEQSSQAAVDAIRAGGDGKLILVPGYDWAGVRQWPSVHPTKWIRDSFNNHRYEAHHYWDSDGSGSYRASYADELAAASSRGY